MNETVDLGNERILKKNEIAFRRIRKLHETGFARIEAVGPKNKPLGDKYDVIRIFKDEQPIGIIDITRKGWIRLSLSAWHVDIDDSGQDLRLDI